MLILRLAASIVASACLIAASSVSRNPLKAIGTLKDVSIETHSHTITALSHFDISLRAFRRRIRLSLEPNHDILPEGAEVHYLGPDGEIARKEVIDRLEHKVFKGDAWAQNVDGSFSKVGWARITVLRDGEHPLLEGVFAINRENYHVQMSKSYAQTRDAKDPAIELTGEDYMIVWRDSDIATPGDFHQELKRDAESTRACNSDSLDFNMDLSHPIYTGIGDQPEDHWAVTPISSLFGKRQIDTGTGAGNGAGVNLVSTIGQTSGCPSMRKVALVGVATDCSYTGTFDSETATRQNVITQLNSASDLYEKTFNITLGLANIVVSSKDCPGTAPAATPWNVPCNGNTDIQARLNLFSQWRGTKQDSYSHWTLLTNCNTGSAVGLAWLGQACVITTNSRNTTTTSGGSGGVQTVSGANVVARTSTEWQVIAHETGHTFGAVHDCTSQTCSDGTSTAQQCCPLSSSTCDAGEKYIMNPSTAQGITNFSPCSIGNICSALGRGSVKSSCLSNNKGITTITGQQCGNGIVETGEDCDCGGESGCTNDQCCDPKTCKFKNGAVCDDQNEECCSGCQLAAANTVCRASTGVCDPAETCTGTSPNCPADKTAPDGQSCGSGLNCATGHCTSRDQQCKTLMGSYTSGNDTYACDHLSCTLSCASPEFGSGVCYGLQQNFLDGTECGGGGHCLNGQCKGSNFGKEIKSWIDDHKPLVIGISCAVGALVLLMILSCIWRAVQRKKHGKAVTPWRGGGAVGSRSYRKAASRSNNSQFYSVPPPTMGQRSNMQQRDDYGGYGGVPQSENGLWTPQPAVSPPSYHRGPSVRYA